jgi:hypothetical protein
MSGKSSSRMWFVFVISVTLSGGSLTLGMQMEQLRQVLREASKSPKSGRVVFVESMQERKASYPSLDTPSGTSPSDIRSRIAKANKNTNVRKTVVFERKTRQIKCDIEDLRDLPALMDAYQLPTEELPRLTQRQTDLVKQDFWLAYRPMSNNVSLSRVESADDSLEVVDSALRYGVINPKMLDGNFIEHSELKEVSVDGRQVIRAIFGGTREGSKWTWTIDFEPALGYRFSRFAVHVEGVLVDETKVSHFIDAGGYIIPRRYERSWYDKNTGAVTREHKVVIDDVKLDIEIPDDAFRLSVPGNTLVQCLIPGVPYSEYVTNQEEKLDPDRVRGASGVKP